MVFWQSIVDDQSVRRWELNRGPLFALHHPRVATHFGIVPLKSGERPESMRTKPSMEMLVEFNADCPSKNTAGLKDATALFVNGPMVLPVFYGVAFGRVKSPVIGTELALTHPEHGVGNLRVNARCGYSPEQVQGIRIENLTKESP